MPAKTQVALPRPNTSGLNVPEALLWHKYKGWYIWLRDPETQKRKPKYFGKQTETALERYSAYLQFGSDAAVKAQSVPTAAGEITVREVVDRFLERESLKFMSEDVDRGSRRGMTVNSLADKQNVARLLVINLGNCVVNRLSEVEFLQLLPSLGNAPSTKWRNIANLRSIFKFANQQLGTKIPLYGKQFELPSLKRRKRRRVKTIPLFEPAHVRHHIHHSAGVLRACIMLGINCGFYAKCCSDLLHSELHDDGFYRGERIKWKTQQAAWLWPETLAAIGRAKTDPEEHERVLLSARGHHLCTDNGTAEIFCGVCRSTSPGVSILKEVVCPKCNSTLRSDQMRLGRVRESRTDSVANKFDRLRRNTGVNWGSFKSFRHTYATIGAQGRDREVLEHTLGHEEIEVTDLYIKTEFDQRLKKLAEFVHGWLWRRECRECGRASANPGNMWTCSHCKEVNVEFDEPSAEVH